MVSVTAASACSSSKTPSSHGLPNDARAATIRLALPRYRSIGSFFGSYGTPSRFIIAPGVPGDPLVQDGAGDCAPDPGDPRMGKSPLPGLICVNLVRGVAGRSVSVGGGGA